MSRKYRTLMSQECSSGFGKLYRGEEFIDNVLYDVKVYQWWIETRSDEPPIEGSKEIEGQVSNPDNPFGILNLIGEPLTLHLEDGRCWDMFIKNSEGKAVNTGKGIYRPE